MDKKPANIHWLQNNNNNAPRRQQNQFRPGPGTSPNGQPPQRGISPLNRWLLVIVLLMLGIFLFQFFNNNNNSSAQQRDELNYSAFYNQINTGNVQLVTLGQCSVGNSHWIDRYHGKLLPKSNDVGWDFSSISRGTTA